MQLRYHHKLVCLASSGPSPSAVQRQCVERCHVPLSPIALSRPAYTSIVTLSDLIDSPASQNTNRCSQNVLTRLKQAVDLTRLGVDVDIEIARSGRQARNGLDVSSKGITAASC